MSATSPPGGRRDRAVTPVIATVTMVAITVVLAAVLGAAMLGVGGGLRGGPPALSVEFTYLQSGSNYEVIASISGGKTITKQNTANITLVADSGESVTVSKSRYPLSGDDDVILNGDDVVPPGTDLELIWTGPDGESNVVARGRTPY